MKKVSIRLFTFIVLLSISISNNIAMERTVDTAEHRQLCHAVAPLVRPANALTQKHSTAVASADQNVASPLAKLYVKKISAGYNAEQFKQIVFHMLPLKLIPSQEMHHTKCINSIAWKPDSTQLATTEHGYALVWDAKTGEKITKLHHQTQDMRRQWQDDFVRDCSWNHDGTQLTTDTGDHLYVWDMQTNQQKHKIKAPMGNVLAFAAWSPDGTRIAIDDCIINAQTGAIQGNSRGLWHEYHRAYIAQWNHSGTQLATSNVNNSICIRDGQTGELVYEIRITLDKDQPRPRYRSFITSLIWNHDDTQLVIAARDKTVRIWDTKTRMEVKKLQHHQHVSHAALNQDCTQLATASDYIARIWNIKTGECVHQFMHDSILSQVAWNNDSSHLATFCAETARIWNAKTGALLHVLPHVGKPSPNVFFKIAWNHTGTHLATSSSTSKIAKIWDTTHLTDPLFQDQHNQLMVGTLAPEQRMVIILCAEFREQNPYVKASLKKVAAYAQTKGVTTAELARALLVLHPVIINGILKHFNVSAQREDLHQEYSYKALQEAQEHVKIPLNNEKTKGITDALEGYIVDTQENYLDSYKALKEAQKYVSSSEVGPIQVALEEYIVDEHPIVASEDNPTQKCEARTA